MPRFLISALPKCDVNCGSLLLMIRMGSPNHLYRWSKYSLAIPVPVISVVHGRNSAAHVQLWSTIVRIASYPSLLGSPVMRSIATCMKGVGFSGTEMR